MATTKAYTDLNQSEKLAEILPLESADMCYPYDRHLNKMYGDIPYVMGYKRFNEDTDFPCWSLSALMNLLPSEFTEVGKYSTTTYEIHIRKYKFTDEVNLYQIAYGSYKWHEDGGYTWSDMINTGEKEDLLDAAFEMICWLKENKKI